MYKIKLLNKISPQGLAVFSSSNYQVGEDIENPDGIIVRSASMHEMELPPNLLAIARAGVGVNNIPVERCTELGIPVFNTPGANANAVKELTIMGLLMSARKIFPAMEWVQSLRGRGDEVPKLVEAGKSKFTGPEIKGKKLGVIGLGTIGVLVANAAVELGMEVYGYDPFLSVDTAFKIHRGVHHANTLKEIYDVCDFITLHVPATRETKGMINSQSLNAMKSGVRILNFARGELVDDDDMLAALEDRQVRCYVTDFPNDKLLGQPGVIALPHLGASTPESEENCAEMAAKQLKDFLETGNVRNSVNFPDMQIPRSGRGRITVTHRNIPTMIAQISSCIGDNINNLTNNSKNGLAYTMMDIDGQVTVDMVERIKALDGVISVRMFK